MPVAGAKPKDQKVTRHAPTHDWTEVPDVPYAGDKPPPPSRAAATKAWWERVSSMPHCVLWTPTDWQFALDTARIHAMFIRKGMGAGELRIREKQMGTTLDARRDLRIRYVAPPAMEETADGDRARVADFEAERRRRLLDAE